MLVRSGRPRPLPLILMLPLDLDLLCLSLKFKNTVILSGTESAAKADDSVESKDPYRRLPQSCVFCAQEVPLTESMDPDSTAASILPSHPRNALEVNE